MRTAREAHATMRSMTLDAGPAFAGIPAGYGAPEREESEHWWLLLFPGVLWLVFSLLVFQFDETSVFAISVLVGVTCIAASVFELVTVPAAHGWWRVARVALAAGFAVVGIVAFAKPGDSFDALAAIFAFYLLLRGLFEIATALLQRHRGGMWGLTLAVGFAEVLLAFWAAGNFGHQAFLLVVWVGAAAMAHGLLTLMRAFMLRPR
jgi:uncharacterized membrane protein HdeD (DUF308 family)